jgi:solute carrier family 32 (vesicular inhibitory amino acid transporter)
LSYFLIFHTNTEKQCIAMKNSVSDKNLYIESEDEEDEVEGCDAEEGAKEGAGSDGSDSSSDESDEGPHGSRPSSYTNQWPQSYR